MIAFFINQRVIYFGYEVVSHPQSEAPESPDELRKIIGDLKRNINALGNQLNVQLVQLQSGSDDQKKLAIRFASEYAKVNAITNEARTVSLSRQVRLYQQNNEYLQVLSEIATFVTTPPISLPKQDGGRQDVSLMSIAACERLLDTVFQDVNLGETEWNRAFDKPAVGRAYDKEQMFSLMREAVSLGVFKYYEDVHPYLTHPLKDMLNNLRIDIRDAKEEKKKEGERVADAEALANAELEVVNLKLQGLLDIVATRYSKKLSAKASLSDDDIKNIETDIRAILDTRFSLSERRIMSEGRITIKNVEFFVGTLLMNVRTADGKLRSSYGIEPFVRYHRVK